MSILRKFVIAAWMLTVSAFAADVAVLQNGFTILHDHREIIGNITRLYPTKDVTGYVDIPTTQIDHFEQDLSSSPAGAPSAVPQQSLGDVVDAVSGRHHLDPDLVNSVIRAESGFNSNAVSRKGAQGLMQLMPQTATQLGVSNNFNPSDNVEGGARYLRELLERYDYDLVKALAAYNAGPDRVARYRGVPPYAETRAYVSRIVKDFNRKKLAEQKAASTKSAKTASSTDKTSSAAGANSGSALKSDKTVAQ